jgi:putative hydrolase of HD superfamily
MTSDRLRRQLDFILEIDKAKQVLRQSLLTADRRHENDAEHAWHMAVMALLLEEYGPSGLDLARVLKMILVHDLVEIDAGDAYVYDDAARAAQAERERAAADRIFALLPSDQGRGLRALWEEFESLEARFAGALDRLQPLLLNFYTDGAAWRAHGIAKSQVLERNASIGDGVPELWMHAQALIEEAVRRGDLGV